MKKVLLFAVAIAALALSGTAFYKTRDIGQKMTVESRKTETVAYLSDIERRIAMFIVPVNYTTNGPWTGFELKASTNNFWHGVAEEIPESVYMQYFMDSDVADTGGLFNEDCRRDRAKLYICNENREDQGLEFRSYTRIPNTLFVTNGISRHIEEVVVLIDSCDLERYPEKWEEDAKWLTWHNNNLMWIYGRKGRAFWEEAHGSKPMWRPIAPVRWFKEMPNWAQLADEEYYIHNPTNIITEELDIPPVVDFGN